MRCWDEGAAGTVMRRSCLAPAACRTEGQRRACSGGKKLFYYFYCLVIIILTVGRNVERHHDGARPRSVPQAAPQEPACVVAWVDRSTEQMGRARSVLPHQKLRPLPPKHPQLLAARYRHTRVEATIPRRPVQPVLAERVPSSKAGAWYRPDFVPRPICFAPTQDRQTARTKALS